MATFTIDPEKTNNYYIDIGTGGKHDATTWIVAKDKNFTRVIDKSVKDKVNLTSWTTPLPKLPEDKSDPNAEEYYGDLDNIYLRVQIHVGEATSNAVDAGPFNQLKQDINITKNLEILEETTTEALGWLNTEDKE